MADIISTLHPENRPLDDLYPNILPDNIPADAVSTARIQNLAVTTPKIANGAITADKIKNGEVTENKIAPIFRQFIVESVNSIRDLYSNVELRLSTIENIIYATAVEDVEYIIRNLTTSVSPTNIPTPRGNLRVFDNSLFKVNAIFGKSHGSSNRFDNATAVYRGESGWNYNKLEKTETGVSAEFGSPRVEVPIYVDLSQELIGKEITISCDYSTTTSKVSHVRINAFGTRVEGTGRSGTLSITGILSSTTISFSFYHTVGLFDPVYGGATFNNIRVNIGSTDRGYTPFEPSEDTQYTSITIGDETICELETPSVITENDKLEIREQGGGFYTMVLVRDYLTQTPTDVILRENLLLEEVATFVPTASTITLNGNPLAGVLDPDVSFTIQVEKPIE